MTETTDPRYQAFLERVRQRSLPTNPITRMKTLAKELSEGTVEELWNYVLPLESVPYTGEDGGNYSRYELASSALKDYLAKRWNGKYPAFDFLELNGYMTQYQNNRFDLGWRLNASAFALLEETEPARIFISYRRKESSAFALLVLARLKLAGLDAFLDMTIQPGDNWQTHLKSQIQSRETFVLLLGRDSLASDVVHQEIMWALEFNKDIIPMWHNGFAYQPGVFSLPPQIDKVLQTTHTIRVLEESALGYNNAIIELLNRFGVTP